MKTSPSKIFTATLTAVSLVFVSAGIANAQELATIQGATISSSNKETNTPHITPEQFTQGLNDLVQEGKLKILSSHETPTVFEKEYGVVDPDSGTVVMSFVTEIPRYEERIWGAMWGWEPAITFNQTDQTAIATGGAAAIAAMATAAAAALAETVVGSVISAGLIAFVGGAATVYISQYGKCPASRPTLWVGTISHRAACR
ncbi:MULTISPECIES: hypothetical protein [unclassified Schaalia]|uniref:hypothetical protein n=1 Tax=unclassified Schaalia TaxID=2691889 RepID=UPI001E3A9330|nr:MULTISPECIES: hypothetical protein [unclassified Schaalia]MCD4549204.1 hypothetical protein [Schaalia sp. lx-260]MCD4556958.1 hypothetical protein [Schaalia sp. lx-100]